jgi:hypothetical protein
MRDCQLEKFPFAEPLPVNTEASCCAYWSDEGVWCNQPPDHDGPHLVTTHRWGEQPVPPAMKTPTISDTIQAAAESMGMQLTEQDLAEAEVWVASMTDRLVSHSAHATTRRADVSPLRF